MINDCITFLDTLAMISGVATHPIIAITTVNTLPKIPTISPFLYSDSMHITGTIMRSNRTRLSLLKTYVRHKYHFLQLFIYGRVS